MITEKLTTLARPYALAAFEVALDKHDIKGWEVMLRNAAAIAEDPMMRQLFTSPDITQKQLVDIFSSILTKSVDDEKQNFLRLLAEYRRLETLPEIAALFANYREQYEKTITVKISSAVPMSAKHEQKFIDALTRKLKRKVSLQSEVDETLIGGAIIRAGDKVIDGSIRGKLNRLLESI